MSLETALEQNTLAQTAAAATMRELINVLTTSGVKALPPAQPVEADGIPPVDALFPKAEPREPATVLNAPLPPAVSYQDLATAILATVKVNRTAVLAVLSELGVKSGKELKPSQYEECLAKVKQIKAEA